MQKRDVFVYTPHEGILVIHMLRTEIAGSHTTEQTGGDEERAWLSATLGA